MTQVRKLSAEYLNSLTKGNEFQRLSKELAHCANTLLSGNTMGARIRRKAILVILSKTHAAIKAMSVRANDEEALSSTNSNKLTKQNGEQNMENNIESNVEVNAEDPKKKFVAEEAVLEAAEVSEDPKKKF